MAPGLNECQTGALPKKKTKSNGFQSHRLSRDAFSQSSLLDWEPMSDLENKKLSYNNKSSTHSEAEGDSISQSDVGRSRSSTFTSQNENDEYYLESGLFVKSKMPDRKQVVSQIQSYLQQTADLMNALKSDSASHESGDSRRMQKFTRIVAENYGPIMATSNTFQEATNSEAVDEELSRKSEESRKKLETLKKRKQDLLKLQDKAKKQLQEAQAEQSRLVAKASTLNQELSSNKLTDLNVQNLNQRLKAVQQMYNTRNQISDSLNENRKRNTDVGSEHLDENQIQELSDTETDSQVVANKMEELNAMKAQLGEIQKMMASINAVPNGDDEQHFRESNEDDSKHNYQNLSSNEEEFGGNEQNNNATKLEQAKLKLNHLTKLLDIVQTAQNANGLSPPCLQLVTSLVNEEADSPTSSPAVIPSLTLPPKNRDKISIETMQMVARELEETTAAMKEERDKLEAVRQELQNMAKKLPLAKSRGGTMSPNDDSESEPPCLKSASLESSFRDILNISGPTEMEQTLKCNDGAVGGPYLVKRHSHRNLRQQQHQQQNGVWNISSNSSMQERQSKNESLSRSSNLSSRNCSRNMIREPRWSPVPSVTFCNERSNPAVQTQNQLEMSNNLCEMALSESGIRPGEISLQGMFSQHQLLTRTVAQCSQLLWLQQKQIIELRNALMLQNGGSPNFNQQQLCSLQFQSNIPTVGNVSPLGLPRGGTLFPNSNSHLPISYNSQPNYQSDSQKLNGGEPMQLISNQDPYMDPIVHHFQQQQRSSHHQPSTSYIIPDRLDYDPRIENFNHLNLPILNQNQSGNMVTVPNVVNGRITNGLNCSPSSEEAGALNNQVPPGNRANNYWDNFRSYSRQNLLSNSKSNEGIETSRRTFSSSGFDRALRDAASSLQNNQSGSCLLQQQHQQSLSSNYHGHLESTNDQFSQLLNQNSHLQALRTRPMDSQSVRSQAKNESRHQGNDSRILSSTSKNESGVVGGIETSGDCTSSGGARSRHTDPGAENIRSLRNDVGPNLRSDNLINTRNRNQSSRDNVSDDVVQGINKKRLERSRGRKEVVGNLNNRGYSNTLWESISSEVSSFIRTNEARPHFLMQLFHDLQQVTTDNLRQRTLESIQETVTANNLMERPNGIGGNVNIIENRNIHANNNHANNNNNNRENRSNLNRNQGDEPARIDELFSQLRENQNTIRQNIGMSSFGSGGNNLENPNISNIRDLVNLRNNLENDGLRDLRTYFEANLCNFGGNHSTLENPNLSNIRENLTRRPPGSDYENINPKNVFLSMYDNVAVDVRRRNLEQASSTTDLNSFGIFEINGGYRNDYMIGGNDPGPTNNNQYELNFEARDQYSLESVQPGNIVRLPILDGAGDLAVGDSRPFLSSLNDSGIDINFNSEGRKRAFQENEGTGIDGTIKTRKKDDIIESVPAESNTIVLPQWQRNSTRGSSFESPSFISLCENSFFNCRSFQELENGDLAEADQSRNDGATSGAESDGGFILPQLIEPEAGFGQSQQSSESNFSGQNVPESERNFQSDFRMSAAEAEGASGVDESAGFPNSASEPEGDFPRVNDSSENLRKSETPEGYYYQLNGASSSESGLSKSGSKYRKKVGNEAEKETSDMRKGSGSSKNVENPFKKCNGTSDANCDGQNGFISNGGTHSLSGVSSGDERKKTESTYSESFSLRLEKHGGGRDKDNTSPEAESDWECGSGGLDQVPTRLKKSGSSRKSNDSGGSIF